MASPSLLAPSDAPSSISDVTRETLGAHIISEIARLNGPQLPVWNEKEILDGFWERFGRDGMTICDHAFGVHNGMWRGAPVTLLRFQASNDEFFSRPLLAEARDIQGDH